MVKCTSKVCNKLAKLNMTTLEERRWRGDLIQTWRTMTDKDMVKFETWFDLEVDRQKVGASTTRHDRQYQAIRPRNYHFKERGRFFSHMVVRDYNSLPDSLKQAMSINTFKNNMDQHRGTPRRPGSGLIDDRLGRQNRYRGSS